MAMHVRRWLGTQQEARPPSSLILGRTFLLYCASIDRNFNYGTTEVCVVLIYEAIDVQRDYEMRITIQLR